MKSSFAFSVAPSCSPVTDLSSHNLRLKDLDFNTVHFTFTDPDLTPYIENAPFSKYPKVVGGQKFFVFL